MRLASVAYCSVDKFSSRYRSLGATHATIRVSELPPRDCFNNDVNLESRYGTWGFRTTPDAVGVGVDVNAVTTLRNTNSDWLMPMDSFSVRPVALVRATRSLPAKSTTVSRLVTTSSGVAALNDSMCSRNKQWDRDDAAFMLCPAMIFLLIPACMYAMASAALPTS